jgi:hypothetical protein
MEELSDAAHRDIPATYLLCNNDRSIPVDIQRKVVGCAEGEISMVECGAGHTAIVDIPDAVVQTILSTSGES